MSSNRRGQGEINNRGEQQWGVWQQTDSASFAGHCWDLLRVHHPVTGLNPGGFRSGIVTVEGKEMGCRKVPNLKYHFW